MGKRKDKPKSPVDQFKELQASGMKPSEIIAQRPDLATALDEIIKVETPRTGHGRGSGSTMDGRLPAMADTPQVPASW